jgi:ornithine cyclodeaminase/alanine dehydrogenase-like protein (mu-crystallin family)
VTGRDVNRIAVVGARELERAVALDEAVEAVSRAFVAYRRGQWTMPSKVYVGAYPAGDFRAMPALGDGHAILKWVTSFPGNPAVGLPTVMALVVVSSADDGTPVALLEGAAVTALRTGAAAVLAAETLGRRGASSASVVGLGPNGQAAVRAFLARGYRDVVVWDRDEAKTRAVARDLGVIPARSLEQARGVDLLVTVTPGREVVLADGMLRAGQHVSLMGADGPGKAEISASELARASVFCDDWEQASHGGEIAHAVHDGLLVRGDVRELGAVLAGEVDGRRREDEITLFDSTGLAIQDLAIALLVVEALPALGGVRHLDLS